MVAKKESEKRFRALVENSSEAIVLFAEDGTILYGSPSTSRILGYSLDEFQGRNAFELIHPDDHPSVADRLAESLRQPGVGISVQANVLHKDGRWRRLEGIFTNFLADPGIRAIVNNYRDVTERELAEEALRESEARYRKISELTSDYTYAFRVAEGTSAELEWASDAVLRVTGYSAKELPTVDLWDRIVYPDDLDRLVQQRQRIFAGEQPGEIEIRIVAKSGEIRWLLNNLLAEWDEANERIIRVYGAARDISERKRAEAVMRESENRYRLLIEQAADGIFVTDTKGSYLDANSKGCQMLGYSRDELLQLNVRDIVIEAGTALAPAQIEELRAGATLLNERMMRRKHGVIFPTETSARMLPDGSIQSIVRDISERKRIEAELRLSEERYRIVSELMSDYAYMVRVNPGPTYSTRLEWVTGAFTQITGYTIEEAMAGLDWTGSIFPEDVPIVEKRRKKMLTGEKDVSEFRMVNKNGEVYWIRSYTYPQWDEARQHVVRIYSAVQEITERKLAEEALRRANDELERRVEERTTELTLANTALTQERNLLRTLIDHLPDHIFVKDTDARFVIANPSVVRHLGTSVVVGKSDFDFFPQDVAEVLYAREQTLMRSGQPIVGEELLVTEPRGDNRWILTTKLPLRNAANEVVGLVGINHDITERKRAEDEIRNLNVNLERRAQELEAANRELEAFSYSVSHDLRAPLRAIDGFSRIIMDDYASQLPSDAQRYLQLVRDNAQQMGELINGLLMLSRLGRQPLQTLPVVPTALVHQVIKGLSLEMENRQVEVTIGELPDVQADAALLRQVFANLLQNALKFTRIRDVATIEVGCQLIDSRPAFFIKDNGVGFDMRYAHKLFGVFQRMHRAEDFEGTGIGLATVQRIIHRHGGRVWAESEINRGATFYFTIGAAENAN